jgi:hypothetical protein
MKKAILISIVSLCSASAFADQCAFITKTQAEKAVKAIIETQSVQGLCEPCGETKAQNIQVDSVGLRKAGYQDFSEVVINNKGIDLAYTYVNGLNLAKLVGCSAQGVSSSIK